MLDVTVDSGLRKVQWLMSAALFMNNYIEKYIENQILKNHFFGGSLPSGPTTEIANLILFSRQKNLPGVGCYNSFNFTKTMFFITLS